MYKAVKRKTAVKCPHCKKVIIGYKYPPTKELPEFNLMKHNENTSRKEVKYNGGYDFFCRSCEDFIRQVNKEEKMSRDKKNER